MSKAALFRLVAFALVVLALFLGFRFLPLKEPLANFLAWVQSLGVWGLVFLGAFYIPASLLLIPGSLVTIAGGAIFGFWETLVAISLGSTAGACAAFLAGRRFARPWVERQVAGNVKFQAIDRAIGEQGFKIVLLLRLSPVFPFNLLNYALSLTRVAFRDYFLASWIGMLPGTVMY
ncbi:MAG TPA: TVP38/TMEM64 family protein, partial [Gemmataceae bacterium]|nr:TVP38/TMEM64 family protein [Gemmataceae bacterium]